MLFKYVFIKYVLIKYVLIKYEYPSFIIQQINELNNELPFIPLYVLKIEPIYNKDFFTYKPEDTQEIDYSLYLYGII